jgi:hypothetical protein
MKSLKEQYGNTSESTSAVNTTQDKTMEPTIVSLTLHTNVTMSNDGIISESAIATQQAKKGVLINTRSGGYIRFNTATDLVYADFYATLNQSVDSLGKYNCSIWEAKMSDDTVRYLTHEESQNLWGMIFLMLGISVDAPNTSVKVKFDFPTEYNGVAVNAGTVDKWIRSGQFRSYSLHFANIEELFKLGRVEEFGVSRNYVLRPSEKAVVGFSRNTVQFAEKYAGFKGLTISELNAPKAKSPVVSMLDDKAVISTNTAPAPVQVQAAAAYDIYDSAPAVVATPVVEEVVEAPAFTGFQRGGVVDADDAEAIAEMYAQADAEEVAQEAVATSFKGNSANAAAEVVNESISSTDSVDVAARKETLAEKQARRAAAAAAAKKQWQ